MAHHEHSAAHVAAALMLALTIVPAQAVDDPPASGAAPAAPSVSTSQEEAAQAEDAAFASGPPVFMAVTGVKADDVLHLRDLPSADSKSLAGIPPNAHGLKKIGCMRVQLSLDRYMYMTKEERNYAQAPWCRVEYQGKQGWVAERYVREDSAPKR